MKKCQFCAEDIQDEAVVCKHCGRDLYPVSAPPTFPPGVAAAATVDPRLSSAVAGYTKRGYKVTSGTFGSVTMERAATQLNWWWMFALLWLFGVGCLVYLLIWAIWGVHKSYGVTLSQGPDGAIHEAGDVVAVFDRDRLRAHRNRLRAAGLFLTVVGLFWTFASLMVVVFSPGARQDTGGMIGAILLFGVLPTVIGFAVLRASRKASDALDAGSAEAAL